MTWQDALEQWYRWLKASSKFTADSHKRVVRLFWQSLPGDVTLQMLTIEHLEAYVVQLSERVQAGTLAPLSRTRYIIDLRAFLRYCDNRDWLSLPLKKALLVLHAPPGDVARPYDLLTPEEAARLLDAAPNLRVLAALSVFLGAGLRNHEAMMLRCGDVYEDEEGRYIRVRHGKWHRGRVVPISPEVYGTLKLLIGERDTSALLFDRTTDSARHWVHACARAAGITKRVTPHSLRHYFAFQLAFVGNPDAGIPPAPLLVVAKMLGHSSLATLGRYLDHLRQADLVPFAPALPKRKEAR